jgi:hypothetical protein
MDRRFLLNLETSHAQLETNIKVLTNNDLDLQNTTQKTKDRVTRIPQKPGMHSGAQKG